MYLETLFTLVLTSDSYHYSSGFTVGGGGGRSGQTSKMQSDAPRLPRKKKKHQAASVGASSSLHPFTMQKVLHTQCKRNVRRRNGRPCHVQPGQQVHNARRAGLCKQRHAGQT